MRNPFRYINNSPGVIRSAVMMYIRYPLSLRQVEDLLFERGIDICHETVRYWWNRFAHNRVLPWKCVTCVTASL
jgi:putative transposase